MKFFKICLHLMRIHSILISCKNFNKKKNPILLLGKFFCISYLIPLMRSFMPFIYF